MLLNLFFIAMAAVNPRIIAFHLRHHDHPGEGQKIKGTIDEGFNGRMFMQVTCPCGVQKEYRLHGYKVVEDFVLELTGDKK